MRTLTGVILIDAGHSALNNAGSVREGQGKTRMNVKKVNLKDGTLPYVSPQAFRYWWRNTIAEESHIAGHRWNLSPIVRGEKTAYTQGNPVIHEDDDIFGYMLTTSADEETEGTVNRRIAPLKCSPLLSVLKNVIVLDEASMMRQEGGFITNNEGTPEEIAGNAVRYKQEWYATILKGAFSLALDAVGVFDVGKGYDINDAIRQMAIQQRSTEERLSTGTQTASNTNIMRTRVTMPIEIRRQRIVDTVKSLSFLRGGAKLTPYLTDTKPKFVIAAVLSCANHIFMEIVREVKENADFDTEAFKEVIRNFGDRIISPVYIGWDKGFLSVQRESFIHSFTSNGSGKTLRITTDNNTNRRQIDFANDNRPQGAIDITICFGSVRDVLEETTRYIETNVFP